MNSLIFMLPTEPIPIPSTSVGREDGGAGGEGIAHAVLDVLDQDVYRDMRWCPNCAGEKVFVEVYEFESGRMGVCLGCGEERVVRFTSIVA